MLCNFCQQDMWLEREEVGKGKWEARGRLFEKAEFVEDEGRVEGSVGKEEGVIAKRKEKGIDRTGMGKKRSVDDEEAEEVEVSRIGRKRVRLLLPNGMVVPCGRLTSKGKSLRRRMSDEALPSVQSHRHRKRRRGHPMAGDVQPGCQVSRPSDSPPCAQQTRDQIQIQAAEQFNPESGVLMLQNASELFFLPVSYPDQSPTEYYAAESVMLDPNALDAASELWHEPPDVGDGLQMLQRDDDPSASASSWQNWDFQDGQQDDYINFLLEPEYSSLHALREEPSPLARVTVGQSRSMHFSQSDNSISFSSSVESMTIPIERVKTTSPHYAGTLESTGSLEGPRARCLGVNDPLPPERSTLTRHFTL